MLLNSDTVVSLHHTPTILVPYESMHVPYYHTWMQDPALLQLTCSEPLTLSQEHENQRSWRTDPKKLTFIILDSTLGPHFIAGDVNLYLLDAEAEGLESSEEVAAEVEVMIAEQGSRRKGLAKHAVLCMMAYARVHLKVTVFIAKVLKDNGPSISLFQHALHFEEYRRIKAFNEVHFKLHLDDRVDKEFAAVRAKWCIKSFKASGMASTPVSNELKDEWQRT